jgi:hypothetical protein
MRSVLPCTLWVLLLAGSAVAAPLDSPRWSESQPGDAERTITVEVEDGGRVTSIWQFPVRLWRAADLEARPDVEPVERWFVARNLSGTKRKGWVFSRTWLSRVDAEEAHVAFEWYATDKIDAKIHALAKRVLRVPLSAPAELKVAARVKVRAKYVPL